MSDPTLTLRLRLWLEAEDGMVLGLGRAMLLAKVAELGSLNKAAKALGMSYRAAWGRMKETERRLGQPLLEKAGPRSGFELTELGRSMAAEFTAFQDDVEAYALGRARERFPWTIKPFADGAPDLTEPGAEPDATDENEQ